jgi:O-antigen ligase
MSEAFCIPVAHRRVPAPRPLAPRPPAPREKPPRAVHRLGTAFAAVYLVAAMGALAVFLVPVPTQMSGGGEAPAAFKLAWLMLYLASFGMLALLGPRLLKRELVIFAIPLYYLVSTAWSHAPRDSTLYGASLVLNTLVSLIIVRCIPPRAFPRFLGRVLFVACMVGLLLYLLGVPSVRYYDVHARPSLIGLEPLRGLFNHKITAGVGGAVAVLLFLYAERGPLRAVGVPLLLFYVLATGSSLAVAVLALALAGRGLVSAAARVRQAGAFYVLSLAAVTVAGVLCFRLFGAQVLELLERDVTLTGRTLLWGWGFGVFLEEPLLGWGYKGYNGTELSLQAAWVFIQFRNYDVPHFHNSYLQIMVEGGIFLLLATCIVFSATFGYWSRRSREQRAARAIPLVMFYVMAGSFFMNQLFQYNNFLTILMTTLFAYAARESGILRLPRDRAWAPA